jgi:lysophospholipase L1-like esterase
MQGNRMKRHKSSFAVVAAVACCSLQAFALDDFYTPEMDKKGLEKNETIDTALPNVLLIGDSISIGYTKPVIQRMAGKANVVRVNTNCGDTNKGKEQLADWLGDTKWDVIHFNFGLHDLCYRHPDAKVYGNRDKVNGTLSVPLPQYEANLESMLQALEKTGAVLIWASTTSVPAGEAGRIVGDEVEYNATAARIMKKHGVEIDDLYALTASFPPEMFRSPGDVHYKTEGYAKLAAQVSEKINTALEVRKK